MKQLLLRPGEVSALAPSSRRLGQAMAAGLGPHTGRVVEFGPGTGRLTEAILAKGVAPSNLTLFELNPEFARHLRLKFPGVTVNIAGADTAADVLKPGVAAVISGLPLLSMPVELRKRIVLAAAKILAVGGCYVQFTYGPRSPLAPETVAELGLRVTKGAKIWANLPPAQVYVYTKFSEIDHKAPSV